MNSQDCARSIPRLSALCAGLLVCACGSTESERVSHSAHDAPSAAERGASSTGEVRTHPVAPSDASAPAHALWEGAHSIVSNGGSYRVYYKTSSTPPPRGDLFAIEAWVLAADHPDEGPMRDVSLNVDAAMPEHEHGMNRIPIATPLGDGHFRIEGLLFHMSGLWQIYFDVTRASVTERAQVDVVLE